MQAAVNSVQSFLLPVQLVKCHPNPGILQSNFCRRKPGYNPSLAAERLMLTLAAVQCCEIPTIPPPPPSANGPPTRNEELWPPPVNGPPFRNEESRLPEGFFG